MSNDSETPPVDEPAAPSASRFSDLHSRTFEMELLISGAVVFALSQVPGYLNRAFDVLTATVDGTLRTLIIYGHVYLLLMISALIVFFLVHLALRAYWIGLVGLESVFPEGIRWDSVSLGPFMKRHLQQKLPPMPKQIEQLDDLCSLVFSFAFLIAHSGIYSMMILGLSALIGLLVSLLIPFDLSPTAIFAIVMGLILVPLLSVTWLDKLRGGRIERDGFAGRLLTRWIRWTYRLSPMPMVGNIQLTLQSRYSELKTTLAIFLTICGLSFAMVAHSLVRADVLRFDSLEYFPDDLDRFGAEPQDYRDQRPPGAIEVRRPSIQSDVIEGPYLKLFVPYYPLRHNPLVEKACPEVPTVEPLALRFLDAGEPDAERSARIDASLGCLASLFRIDLDGSLLPQPDWAPTREAGTRLVGLMAYLPTGGLTPGRHRLRVSEPWSEAKLEAEEPETPRSFEPHEKDRVSTLYFWR